MQSLVTWLSTACVRQHEDEDKGRLYLQDKRLCFSNVRQWKGLRVPVSQVCTVGTAGIQLGHTLGT